MHIFVTGASGFIGQATVRHLAGLGHQVSAMSRSAASDATVSAAGAHPVRCALGAVAVEHLRGHQAVVHAAAFAKQWGSRSQFWQANVEGTQQLLDVARQAGVARFIHLGTEAALFDGGPLRDIDETHPYPHHSPYLYSESKGEAERRVLAAPPSAHGGSGPKPGAATANTPASPTAAPEWVAISLRPRLVWGPGDQTVLPVIVEMVRKGRFAWIDQGRAQTSTTHIDNIVHAINLALTNGRSGQAYFIADEGTTTLRDFFTALLATQGLTPPDKSIPAWVGRWSASVLEALWRLLRIESDPPLTRLAAAMLANDCTVRTGKARDELGYRPVISRDEGLRQLA